MERNSRLIDKVDDIYEKALEIQTPPGEVALTILGSGTKDGTEKHASLIVRTRELIRKSRNSPLTSRLP